MAIGVCLTQVLGNDCQAVILPTCVLYPHWYHHNWLSTQSNVNILVFFNDQNLKWTDHMSELQNSDPSCKDIYKSWIRLMCDGFLALVCKWNSAPETEYGRDLIAKTFKFASESTWSQPWPQVRSCECFLFWELWPSLSVEWKWCDFTTR